MVQTDSLAARVQQMITTRGLTVAQVAGLVGISGQGLRDILSNRSKRPKSDIIIKLALALNVSTDWLLTGRERETNETTAPVNQPKPAYLARQNSYTQPSKPVTFLPARLMPEFIKQAPDLQKIEGLESFSLPASIAPPGNCVAFEMEDSCMMPEIPPNALVVCTLETDPIRYVPSGTVYVILYNGRVAISRVHNRIAENGTVEMQPRNPLCAPMAVKAEDVRYLYRVKFVIHRS